MFFITLFTLTYLNILTLKKPYNRQGKNLTGVMPVKGHFARQKHTHNKNACQVEISIFHVKGPYKLCMSNDMLKFYFPCHIYYIYICHFFFSPKKDTTLVLENRHTAKHTSYTDPLYFSKV